LSEELIFNVDVESARLDEYVSRKVMTLSRNQARKLVLKSQILVEGVTAKPSTRVVLGQVIKVFLAPSESVEVDPENIPIEILYEDDDLIVVDKPSGLPVHAGAGHASGTLVNALLYIRPDLQKVGNSERPGIVHRLDIDTSGVMVVAKNLTAHAHVSAQLSDRSVNKIYLALVKGSPSQREAIIDAPIGRDPGNRKKMAIVDGGRSAKTRYKIIKSLGEYELLEVKLLTGRTHQIRVHLSSIGHPIIGDKLYGTESKTIKRQFLHSHLLGFVHPSTGKHVEFNSPLPKDLLYFLTTIES
jgi:23S rRNA pseudouridine1911/1915/1917 synthase